MRRYSFSQVVVFIAGLFYLFVALALLLAPRWFYDTFATFPPFNRHYMGDVGAFTLALAIGLLLAARDPLRYRLWVGLAALASVVHTANPTDFAGPDLGMFS